MARRNFTPAIIKARLKFAGHQCEGTLADGSRCLVRAVPGRFHGDHDNPDGLTGEPTFENCRILCLACHATKTARDVKDIAKAKRREADHLGLRKAIVRDTPKIRSAGFAKSPKATARDARGPKTQPEWKRRIYGDAR